MRSGVTETHFSHVSTKYEYYWNDEKWDSDYGSKSENYEEANNNIIDEIEQGRVYNSIKSVYNNVKRVHPIKCFFESLFS